MWFLCGYLTTALFNWRMFCWLSKTENLIELASSINVIYICEKKFCLNFNCYFWKHKYTSLLTFTIIYLVWIEGTLSLVIIWLTTDWISSFDSVNYSTTTLVDVRQVFWQWERNSSASSLCLLLCAVFNSLRPINSVIVILRLCDHSCCDCRFRGGILLRFLSENGRYWSRSGAKLALHSRDHANFSCNTAILLQIHLWEQEKGSRKIPSRERYR